MFIFAPDNELPKPSEIRKADAATKLFWGFVDGMLNPRPAMVSPPEPARPAIKAQPTVAADQARALTPRQRAVAWLREQLSTGPKSSVDIERRAHEDGIAMKTLRRAAKDMSIKPQRSAGHWWWQDAQPQPGS